MAAKNAPLKVAVIGAGSIGHVHIQGYQKTGKAEVVALCDVVGSRAAEVAEKYGIPRAVSDISDLWDLGLDAVSVCVPNAYHAEVAIKALRHGVPVLCEKPMANSLENAALLRDVVHETGTTFMMGFNNRHRTESQAIRKAVDAGELGRVYYAKCGWVRRQGIPGMGGWFTTKALSGGGPLMDIGVHVLDLTMYLMGCPKPVSVMGATYAEFGPRGRGLGDWGTPSDGSTFDVEDLGCGFVRFENGATLILEASWAQYVGTDSFYSTLYGTEGGANLDPFAFYKDGPDGKPADDVRGPSENQGHNNEIEHFVDCLLTGKQPIGTADEGYNVIRILDALYRSAESGSEVKL